MIVCLAVPAYRQVMHAQTAYAWVQDALTAQEMGWRPMPLWLDVGGFARARNKIVQQAEQAGARLLLMCDSDTMPAPPEGGLRSMWQAMQDTGAAVVGAAVPVRNGAKMNCEPARPGEVYEGVCGTAYMLVDIWKLRAVPKPWFVYEVASNGIDVECGEDIGFCRLVRQHGHTVTVNYALPMAHAEQSAVATKF